MKKYLSLLCSLLLILTCTSCGNLNAGKDTGAKATLNVKITNLEQVTDRAAATVTPSDITGYEITLSTVNGETATPLTGFPKTVTAAQAAAGVSYGNLNPGTYRVAIKGFKASIPVLTGESADIPLAAGETKAASIDVDLYKAFLSDGTAGTSGDTFINGREIPYLINSETLPATFTPSLTDIPASWGTAGQTIIGWEDADGNSYDLDQAISLDGKTLPLLLKAIWGSSAVTYRFDYNYTNAQYPDFHPEIVEKDGIRRTLITLPEYEQYKDYDGGIKGAFNDRNFYIEGVPVSEGSEEMVDEIGYLSLDDDAAYYFCGWSVNTQLDMLLSANYADNLNTLKNTTIVQPGEQFMLKDAETTFYAVWASTELGNKILDVRYQWGDARSNCDTEDLNDDGDWIYIFKKGRTNAHRYYLVDNSRTDTGTGYTSYSVPLKMPSVPVLFSQYEDYPQYTYYEESSIYKEKLDRWDDSSFKTAGSTFNYAATSATGKLTLKYPVKTIAFYIENNGSTYSMSDNKTYIKYVETFPVPDTVVLSQSEFMNYTGFVPVLHYSDYQGSVDYSYTFYDLCFYEGAGKTYAKQSTKITYDIVEAQYVVNMRQFENNQYLYAEWKLNSGFISEKMYPSYSYIMYSLDDVRKLESDYTISEPQTLAAIKESDADYAAKNYYLAQGVSIDELTEPLFETFNGVFYGLDNGFEVWKREDETAIAGNAPLFGTIDENAMIEHLHIFGKYGNYADEWVGEHCGVLCNENYGQLSYIEFAGTAYQPITGIFGYQNNGMIDCYEVTVSPYAEIGDIPAFCPNLTMVSVPEGTVRQNVGAGAFTNASAVPVFVESFLLGETEIPYDLWYRVYHWATTNEYGQYTFEHEGAEGDNGVIGAVPTEEASRKPVTGISWVDAALWCNAFSEFEGLTPVYLSGYDAAKNADELAYAQFASYAEGYRLPTDIEWEYAARGGNPDADEWTYKWAGIDTASVLSGYAVYGEEEHTKAVKGDRTANSLGLYDMSGNVCEWTGILAEDGVYSVHGGSAGMDADSVKVDAAETLDKDETSATGGFIGFRVARSPE